jgi:predicted AAA+ superfamily ATPase
MRRLTTAGALLITGPKWCGKSTTGRFHAASLVNMDLPENKEQFKLAPALVMEGASPRLIDEWQDAPSVWDRARRMIDEGGEPGRFIFTGSAVPGRQPSHTGTGRFSRIKMRTMTLLESGDSTGAVSLRELFDTNRLTPTASRLTYQRAVELVCRGGWPQVVGLPTKVALELSRDYLDSLVASDLSRVDGIRRNPEKLRVFLRSLARTVSTSAKVTTLQADIASNLDESGISEKTVHSYLNALRQIFVLEEQAAWTAALRSKTRIRTRPVRHFTDPSLAAAVLGATPDALMRDTETAGLLFESMCIRDLDVYAAALDGQVFYYKNEAGLEVDAIIQLDDGRWGAIEIKMGVHQFDEAARNLLALKRIMGSVASCPSFLAIITATSGYAATREDGVHIIPLDLLAS